MPTLASGPRPPLPVAGCSSAAVPVLVKLLANRPTDYEQWTEDKNRLAERRTMIDARAHAAFGLGFWAEKPGGDRVLVEAVKHRGVHPDRMLAGFDGVVAASALGRLHAAETAGTAKSCSGDPGDGRVFPLGQVCCAARPTLQIVGRRTQAAVISDMRTCWRDCARPGRDGRRRGLGSPQCGD